MAALRKDEALEIPDDFQFSGLSGLSNELQAKLVRARPTTLAQAGKVEGMTPAALSLLLVHIKRSGVKKSA